MTYSFILTFILVLTKINSSTIDQSCKKYIVGISNINNIEIAFILLAKVIVFNIRVSII